MRILAKRWASYRERVLSPDAPMVQVQEKQCAFYAGAQAVWNAILELGNSDSGAEPTEAELAGMDAMQAELEAFVRDGPAGGA